MIRAILRDGTILNCNIYETGKAGERPIENHERINYLFSQLDMINFQTKITFKCKVNS